MGDIKSSKYFYCYSARMRYWLKAFGINYITQGINPKTNTAYYMFEKSEKLDACITLWNKNKCALDEYADPSREDGDA